MAYWASAFEFAWRETKRFTPIKSVPSILAAGLLAWFQGASTMKQWARISCVLLGSYVLLAMIEFLYNLVVVAPAKLYGAVNAEKERLVRELNELLNPKLEILFEAKYPYDDKRRAGPTQIADYRLFRVGVRNSGLKTVAALKVQISDVKPRPEGLFIPVLLPAMHDRADVKMTELHPNKEPWYFDVVDQLVDGTIRIVHTVQAVEQVIPPDQYIVTIDASGRDVPSVSKRFVVSVPTPRQGNQDLQFSPVE